MAGPKPGPNDPFAIGAQTPVRMPPSASDPLGENRNPSSILGALENVVDARIKLHLSGRSSDRFADCTDMALVVELITRGWAVFRPRTQDPTNP